MLPTVRKSADEPLVVENRKATRGSLRERNQRLVLQQVLSGSPISRADIARSTGLTRASVSELVGGLMERQLLREIGPGAAAPAGGKPPTLLQVDSDAQQFVCVDASADRVRAARVDLAGEIVEVAHATQRGLHGDDVVAATLQLMRTLQARVPGSVAAFAVGTPGLVQGNSVVRQATNLGWRDRDLGAELARAIGAEVLVINDAQAAALAEYSVTPERTSNIVSVLIGSGIGAGIVLSGRLYRGETSSAGEIGHIRVGGSQQCSCGHFGCLETLASVPSLLRSVGSAGVPGVEAEQDLASALALVDDDAWQVAAVGLATALWALVAVLDVKDIVLGGAITAAGSHFLGLVQRELEAQVLSGREPYPQVRFSELEEHSVLLGTAAYALHRRLGVGWTP